MDTVSTNNEVITIFAFRIIFFYIYLKDINKHLKSKAIIMTEFNKQDYSGTQSTGNLDDFNRPAKPDNYLVLSIVSTVLGLCSCVGLILGIIAIVFATQVDTKYTIGDYEGALKASNNAKILSIIALVFGILGIIANIVYFVIVGGSILSQYS